MPTPVSPEMRPVPAGERGPELASSPEAGREQAPTAPERRVEPVETAPTAPSAPVAAAPVTPPPQSKDATHMKLERKLEENLWDVYRALDTAARATFKQRGEEVSVTLRAALGTPKLQPRFVLRQLSGWLGLIPNANKYFLEQEAKIKTDHVLQIDREYRAQNLID